MSLILLGILNSQVEAAGGGSYDLLESVVLSSNTATVTFSNLNNYSAYKHLQLRAVLRDTNSFASTIRNVPMRFNGDSGSNYFAHELIGDPGAPGVFSQSMGTPTTSIAPRATIDDSATANVFVASVWDILDFSNTNKNKTVKILSGTNQGNTDARIVFSSGAWNNTGAITSISIGSAESHKIGSRLSLYGIKG